jgi:large subunit ribosomal protein L24
MERVKKGDLVVILAGKDRQKRGKILRVFPEDGRVTVEGLNLVKRHMRKTQDHPQGVILSREAPLPLSRVQPICPKCNRGVRVGFRILADGTKARVCRRCGEAF